MKNETGDWLLINQFGDLVERSVNQLKSDIKKIDGRLTRKTVWTYWYWEKETRTRPQGSLNKIKKYLNEKRKTKCSWTETTRTDYENRSKSIAFKVLGTVTEAR